MNNLVALLVGHSLLAVWVQEEAELRGEAGFQENGEAPAAQRIWIQRLFPAEVSGPDGPTSTDSGSLTTSRLATELSTDAIFLGGPDALIKGFGLKPRVPPVPIPR